MPEDPNNQDLVKIIVDMVDRQEVCFLQSINADGFPTARAMLNPRKRHGLREFYLTTNTSSEKVQNLLDNPKAGLYFYDRPTYRGLAFTGMAEILHDQDIKDEIWRDMDTIFYENNTDPDYCVIKFIARKARYYDSYKSINLDLGQI